MTDKVHPSSNPNNTTTTLTNNTVTKNTKLPLPPAKAPLHYPKNTHPYRPNPANYLRKRHHSSRFCFCCFWSLAIIITILILAIISACILYLLYRPHRPTFSVTSLKFSQFNLTTAFDGTTRLTSNLNVTICVENPNENIVFYYDPFVITCLTDEELVANDFFNNSFVSDQDKVMVIRSSLGGNDVILEAEAVKRMRSELKRKLGMRLKVVLETKVVAKVESFRSRKVGVRIECEGIRGRIPKRSSSSVSADVSDAKCEVDFRIKIWKWEWSF